MPVYPRRLLTRPCPPSARRCSSNSTSRLLIAQCKAGIVGSTPALNARPAAPLEDRLIEITEELAVHDVVDPDRPGAVFAISQIVHKNNDRLDHDMFTGVHGNYLAPSIVAAGLELANLPQGELKTMNFGDGEGGKPKSWKDIWGSSQDIGVIDEVNAMGVYIDELKREYQASRADWRFRSGIGQDERSCLQD